MAAIILGAFLLCTCAYLTADWVYRRLRCTVPVTARVEAVEGQKPSLFRGERRGYYPVYSFTLEGRPCTVRPREPSRTNRWKVGDEAKLHVAPGNPDCFRVGNQIADLVYAGTALALGALFLIIGICF